MAENIFKMWLNYSSNFPARNALKLEKGKHMDHILNRIGMTGNFISIKTRLQSLSTVSHRTSRLEKYKDYLESFHYQQLFEFNMFNSCRKWKYNTYVSKQKVII